jgi:transcriptional regulator with XRE-family HTH domain
MINTEKIREVMKANRWTSQSLADAAGLSRQSVWAMLEGRNVPKIENLQKICTVLNLEITAVLLNGDAEPEQAAA